MPSHPERLYSVRGRFNDTAFYLAKTWKKEGVTIAQIAVRLHSSRATVGCWLQRDQPPSAQVRKADPRKKKKVAARRALVEKTVRYKVLVTGIRLTHVRKLQRQRQVDRYPYGSCGKVARKLTADGISLSKTTAWRDLKALGLKAYVAQRMPRLTANNKTARLEFANRILRMPQRDEYVRRLAFSDEKWYDSDDGRTFHWRRPKESVPCRYHEKFGPRVMVWGVIAVGFRKLVMVPSDTNGRGSVKIDAAVYEELIRPVVADLRKRKLIFQQDNAPSHSAVVRSGVFARWRLDALDGWPAVSPDLNPVETMWSIVSRKVSARAPFGEKHVWEYTLQEWESVPQSVVDDLCLTFAKRLSACRRLKGAGVTAAELRKEG